MVSIWGSHQRCSSCGWIGTTRAHKWVVVACVGYLLMVVAVVVLDGQEIITINSLSWPFFVAALAWYYIVPSLIWRWNACGGCKTKLDVELVARRKPPKA